VVLVVVLGSSRQKKKHCENPSFCVFSALHLIFQADTITRTSDAQCDAGPKPEMIKCETKSA
jgi:hypothetical protein